MNRSPSAHDRSKLGWSALLVVLSVEAFVGLALLFQAANGMLEASNEPLGMRLSIFLALLLAWAWVCVTLFGGFRSRASWVRGSALTIHVLLFAAATGMLQIGIGGALLAWGAVLLALVGFFAALIARPVYSADDAPEGAPSGE